MTRISAVLVACALIAIPAAHAAPAKPASCELTLDADKIDANIQSGKGGTASGNVIVTQCDMKMQANAVRVTMANNQYDQIIATGKVVLISQKSGIVTGDNGVYEVPKKVVTMTGHVVLKNGTNVLTGTQLTYNVATGQAHVDAAPAAAGAGTGTGRVHAVLTPPDSSPK